MVLAQSSRWAAGAVLLAAAVGLATYFGTSPGTATGQPAQVPAPVQALPPAANLRIRVADAQARSEQLLDFASDVWNQAPPTAVILNRTPRIYQTEPVQERPIPGCQVRALRAADKLFLQLQWDDSTKNAPEAPAAWKGEGGEPKGPEVLLYLEIPEPDGTLRRLSIDKTLVDSRNDRPFPKTVKWRFTGSVMSKPDPNKDETVYGADLTGTLISIFPVTDQTVFQTSLTMKEEKYLKLETNTKSLPAEGTAVKLVVEAPKGKN